MQTSSTTPRQLGPWRLEEVLGAGGMGTVWRARHASTGETAALKAVHAADEATLGSLRREIRALASLRHPGVVRILDHGDVDGAPWYAMALVEGAPLSGWRPALLAGDAPTIPPSSSTWWTLAIDPEHGVAAAERGARNPAATVPTTSAALGEVLGIARRLCAILGWLHGEGFVHRDLKPDNVLVRPGLEPVLVDFGIAARFGAREHLQVVRAAGSVAYVAPEQVRGELVDARADLYALGCVLLELITGAPPFADADPSAVIQAHLARSAPRISDRVEGLPPALDDLVASLLRKEPDRRPGHAEDVGRALEELGAASPPTDWPRPRSYVYRPRLVGRREPIGRLVAALNAARAGRGDMLTIAGESGAGKTRLLVEMARSAVRLGVTPLFGGAEAAALQGSRGIASTRPFGPFQQVAEALADRCLARGEPWTEALLDEQVAPALRYLPALARLARVPVPNAPDRATVHAALQVLLARVAAEGALVIALDDLQWADGLTTAFLASRLASPSLTELPILWVLAWRAEERNPALDQLLAHPRIEHRRLGRLEPDDAGDVVASMLALPEAPAGFAAWLVEQTEGIPFYLVEYVRNAVAERVLARDSSGRWRLVHDDYDRLPLPSTLAELVACRLDGLDPSDLDLVRTLAVLGREAGLDVLADVAGLTPDLVEEGVSRLVRVEIVEATGDRVRFSHDKLREVAYAAWDDPREAHARAAAALEARGADEPSHVAVHWERAGRTRDALRCYAAAARRAAATGDHEEQIRQAERYLALPFPRDADTLALLDALVYTLAAIVRDRARATGTLPLLRACAEAIGTADAWARHDLLVATTHAYGGRAEDADDALTGALARQHELTDRAVVARALGLRAIVAQRGDDLEAAVAHRRLSHELFLELGDRAAAAGQLYAIARLQLGRGRTDEATREVGRALQLVPEGRATWWKLRAFQHTLLGRTGDLRGAIREILSLRPHLAEVRRDTAVLLQNNLAWYLGLLGELDAAAIEAREAVALARRARDRDWVLTVATAAAIAFWSGADREAAAMLLDARAHAERFATDTGVRITWWRARVALRSGDREAAAALAQEALSLAPAGSWRDDARWLQAHLLTRRGALDEAGELLDAAADAADAPVLLQVAVEQAWLARARGAPDSHWTSAARSLCAHIDPAPASELLRRVRELA